MTQTPSECLTLLRQSVPLVHCITNFVAMNLTANVLLAAGAAPAMVHAPEEAGAFAPMAGALSINIGTPDALWVAGMEAAIDAATAAGRPWVLDPVAHFITPWRRALVLRLLDRGPAVIRANASEVLTLAGEAASGRGVDAGDSVAAAETAARRLAAARGCVVAVTGEVDFVTDGTRAWRVEGGAPLMPQVTATGCALSALVAGYAAVCPPAAAATAALAHFAAAGLAARAAPGPGSFAVAFVDALAGVTPADLDQRVHPA